MHWLQLWRTLLAAPVGYGQPDLNPGCPSPVGYGQPDLNPGCPSPAGYGRPDLVRVLLDAGSKADVKNSTGKTPLDLVKLSPQNPVNNDPELLERLAKK